METFNSLKNYCIENDRIVPVPTEWNKLWDMLKNKKQKASGGWEPPLPLILAAWDMTSSEEKQERFLSHIHWAENNGQLEEAAEFIKSLPENKWYHLND